MIRKILILALALGFVSCIKQEPNGANARLSYFDVKGYFNKEINRLQQTNPTVQKTVSVNGTAENRKLKIPDWQKELAVFTNADINKASWQGEFKITASNQLTIYSSANKKIPVKKILLTHQHNKLAKIVIIVESKNILFQSTDTLTYAPDRFYEIKKFQKIRFLKQKYYHITGKIN
ncbi:hypothetical protein [Pedobacter sp. BMA]|uniref:hypothetical protein n=1 Tax=Pedobacter sp. BMA TaxID=1663685 RepID=UPI0006497239|nr:hypothetical protein [Pedobacter sp. BMA]KLT65747.1 hypothetical protein AB669_11890 [Pedobacter sp. BMA]